MITLILALSPAVVSASAAVIVMAMSPVLASHRGRREEVNKKLDLAIATLHQLNAARYSNQSVDGNMYVGTEDERHRFQVEIQEESLKRYIALTNEARLRMADIASYLPELRERLSDKWELTEEDVRLLTSQIDAGRVSAVKSERLFRTRLRPYEMA